MRTNGQRNSAVQAKPIEVAFLSFGGPSWMEISRAISVVKLRNDGRYGLVKR